MVRREERAYPLAHFHLPRSLHDSSGGFGTDTRFVHSRDGRFDTYIVPLFVTQHFITHENAPFAGTAFDAAAATHFTSIPRWRRCVRRMVDFVPFRIINSGPLMTIMTIIISILINQDDVCYESVVQ